MKEKFSSKYIQIEKIEKDILELKDEINYIIQEKKNILKEIKEVENSNKKIKNTNNILLKEYEEINNEYLSLLKHFEGNDLNYLIKDYFKTGEKNIISNFENKSEKLENKIIKFNSKYSQIKKDNINLENEKEIQLLEKQIKKENNIKKLLNEEIKEMKIQISNFEKYISKSILNLNYIKEQICKFIDIESNYNSIKGKNIIMRINIKSNISKLKNLII